MRICENRYPLGLNLEAKMAAGIEPDAASDSERETREVVTAGNMGSTHAGNYERPGPGGPVLDIGLMAEVSMKLVKNHVLTGRYSRDVLRVHIRGLPCPAYFDQVSLICESQTKRSSIARARIEYDARVQPHDMGLNWKAHAGAITDEWSEIKTQRLWRWRWLWLRTERGRQCDQQHHNDNKRLDNLVRQFSEFCDSDAHTIAPGRE